jgi:amino acid transporter
MNTIQTYGRSLSLASPSRGLARWRITLPQLVAATYLMVAGGPYGLEEIVQRAGYQGAILILLATPMLWSVPTALMVSELSSALPEQGGYYAWVKRALGPFWGFQEAWLSLVVSIFDMALYPTLFAIHLARLCPALGRGPAPFAIGVLLIVVCVRLNLRGAGSVGSSPIVLLVALMGPFVVLILIASSLPAVPAPETRADGAGLLGGILIAMWNYMGWDNSSTVAKEVDKPARTYPLGMHAARAEVAHLPPGIVAQGIDDGRADEPPGEELDHLEQVPIVKAVKAHLDEVDPADARRTADGEQLMGGERRRMHVGRLEARCQRVIP